jgi:Phage gp6-like head-tail connector protein
MATELVRLEVAKLHLRIADDLQDDDIEMKLQQASAILMQHMKLSAVPSEWLMGSPPSTIDPPANIQGYTLLILSELFENREASVFNINQILTMIPREHTFA